MNGILNTINTNPRTRRFAAFCIDLAAVAVILSLLYGVAGFPDFPAVAAEMERANLAAAPSQAKEIAGGMLAMFNAAYLQTLLVWFCYEVLSLLMLGGSTPGKLLMRLKLVPVNGNRGRLTGGLFLMLRSFLKLLMMYLFQGFPFLLSVLYSFMDEQSRTGYDRIAKLTVVDRGEQGLIENV